METALIQPEDLLSPLLTETFSNYTLYFFKHNNGVNINCSVYFLNQGFLSYQDYFTGEWFSNAEDTLPAYYITNCSVAKVLQETRNQNISDQEVSSWLQQNEIDPVSNSNGDKFVSLLFSMSGLCVLFWMLLLLHLLLPPHRRKPWLVVLCTLVNSVVLTAALTQVTLWSEVQYHNDGLDVSSIMAVMRLKRYPYALIVLHLLIYVAFVQLLWKMVKGTWRWRSLVTSTSLTIVSFVFSLILVSVNKNAEDRPPKLAKCSLLVAISVEVAFLCWFSVVTIYYTAFAKPPLVSYSRRLLPLAGFTWTMICAKLVTSSLCITYWPNKWSKNVWIIYLFNFIDIIVLTASWEWLFLIQQAEQRIELSGMLGRRISVDDVRNLNTDWSQNGPGKKYPFMTWLREKFQHEKNIQDSSEERAYSHLDNVTEEVELRPLPSIRSRNDQAIDTDSNSAYDVQNGDDQI